MASRLRSSTRRRSIPYPLGRGQADEIALRAGFRPLIRELLTAADMPAAVTRFERAGFNCVVAPRVYGPTHDGWDATPQDFDESSPHARRALFIGREAGRARAAAELELVKSADADREMGRLLGYPRCCVERFVNASHHRKNLEVYRAALDATGGVLAPRLNMLDLGIFHYLSFFPCSFDCAMALRYANAIAQTLVRVYPAFVGAIDAALALHRVVLLDEVQLCIDGRRVGDVLEIERTLPAAMFRHPDGTLDPDEEEAVVRALALLEGKRTLRVDGAALVLDGEHVKLVDAPLVVPFGP
jgi:hypothetical protein